MPKALNEFSGVRTATLEARLRKLEKRYADTVRETLGGNGAAMGEAEDALRECRQRIRDLKKSAKAAGINIPALGFALKLQRMDDYDARTALFDAIDQYAKMMRLWEAPGE